MEYDKFQPVKTIFKVSRNCEGLKENIYLFIAFNALISLFCFLFFRFFWLFFLFFFLFYYVVIFNLLIFVLAPPSLQTATAQCLTIAIPK